jgi:hypothetical protein
VRQTRAMETPFSTAASAAARVASLRDRLAEAQEELRPAAVAALTQGASVDDVADAADVSPEKVRFWAGQAKGFRQPKSRPAGGY